MVDKSKKIESDWRLFLRLAPYAKNSQSLLIVSILLLIPLALSGSVQPLIIGQTISLIKGEKVWPFLVGHSLSSGLILLIIILILTVAVRLALSSLQSFSVQKVGQQITAEIREDLFVHITRLGMRFFDQTQVGKLITRLTSDVESLGDVFATGAVGIFSDLFSILVITFIVFFEDWRLALLLIFLLVSVNGIIIYCQQSFRLANYKVREELSRLNSMLQENIVGINVVQVFQREDYNALLFKGTNKQYIKEVDVTIWYDSVISAILEWVGLMAIALILWVGGAYVIQEEISFGTLSAFILYAQRFFEPIRQFAEKFTLIQSGFTAIERIMAILEEPIEIEDKLLSDSNVILPKSLSGAITFDGVFFGYKADEYVIKDLSFSIKPGEKIALVGPTGAGKSSVIRLLCRLYDINEGEILIDGVNIKDYPQWFLRREIGVVLQDGFLFAGDVRSNIALGENYSWDEIQEAAEKTNVADFIEGLPNGYDTQLRERGTNISAGQKQLLAFARVAIRNPSILILDEATASLDVGTESKIQDALDRLMMGRTSIIIAHRLSTIRSADRILVLRRGQLAELGSHEELLAQGGLYASLYKLQMLGS